MVSRYPWLGCPFKASEQACGPSGCSTGTNRLSERNREKCRLTVEKKLFIRVEEIRTK